MNKNFSNWFSEIEVFSFNLVHSYSPLLSIIHKYSLIHATGKVSRLDLLQFNGAMFVFCVAAVVWFDM